MMKVISYVFLFMSVFAAFFFSSCSPKDENTDNISCETILDCPEGYTCGPDNICIKIEENDSNQIIPDNEQNLPDDTKNDNNIVPDNEKNDTYQHDDNPPVDNNDLPDENDETIDSDNETVEDSEYDDDYAHDFDSIDEDPDIDKMIDETDDETNDDDDYEFKEEIIIGDDVKADNAGIPIGCNHVFKYLGSAALYDMSEIGQAGKILKVGWYDVEGSNTDRPVKIFIKETDETTVPYTTWNTQVSGATLVFDQNITTVSGWNSFELTVPFDYSGAKNLLVFAQVSKGSYCTSNYYRYTEAAGKNRYWKEETTIGGKTPSTMGTGWRPNIKFNFEIPVEDNDNDIIESNDETADEDTVVIYDDVIVGTGTSGQWTPLSSGLFKYTRSAGIYLGSEINVSSTITKIAWYADAANSTSRPVKIYLKETSNDTHTSVTWNDMISDATLLFDASVTISNGWNDFVLSAPFNFNKSKNLMVMVEMNKGDSYGGNSYIRYSSSTSKHQTWNAEYIPTGSGTIDSARPNIKISF